jgi:uncharacterized damage-inducible protein DinB
MEKTLSQLHEELEQTTARAHPLFALSDHQFTTRPPTGKWSVAENINHLTLINTDYLKVINDALAANADQKGNEPYALGFLGKWFTRLMEPPVRVIKMPTTKNWTPQTDTITAQTVKDGFLTAQDALAKSLEASQGMAIDSITAASPENKYLKLSLVEMYAILLSHNRRHLWISEQFTLFE